MSVREGIDAARRCSCSARSGSRPQPTALPPTLAAGRFLQGQSLGIGRLAGTAVVYAAPSPLALLLRRLHPVHRPVSALAEPLGAVAFAIVGRVVVHRNLHQLVDVSAGPAFVGHPEGLLDRLIRAVARLDQAMAVIMVRLV